MISTLSIEMCDTWSDAEKEAVCRAPFRVTEESGKFILEKKVTLRAGMSKVNLILLIKNDYVIDELFFDIFYCRKWVYCPSDTTIKKLNLEISDLFFNNTYYNTMTTPKQRYLLLHQFEKREEQQSTWQETPFLSELREQAQAENLPLPETYSQALECAAKIRYHLPENKILIFYNSDDFLVWAFQKMIETNRMVGFCPICKTYFLKIAFTQKFCNRVCYMDANRAGSFCGYSEIKKNYHAIDQAFNRKSKSRSQYTYQNIAFGEDYDALGLFSQFTDPEKRKTPWTALFSSEDFKLMKKEYTNLYYSQYQTFRESYELHGNGEIPDALFSERREALCTWQENVRRQLKAFELDHVQRK